MGCLIMKFVAYGKNKVSVEIPFDKNLIYRIVIEQKKSKVVMISFYCVWSFLLQPSLSYTVTMYSSDDLIFQNDQVTYELTEYTKYLVNKSEIEIMNNLLRILADKDIVKQSLIYFLGM